MLMPGRKYKAGSGSYRYSLNGQEKETELNESITTAEFWEYDERIGRRWNIDVKPNVAQSPYSCFNNSPVWFSDVKGDTTYRFNNKDGRFLGMVDLNVKGIRGSTGSYTTQKDVNGKEFQAWQPSNNFSFNDDATDRSQLNSLQIGQKGITFVNDENINWVMNKSDIKHRSLFSRWDYALSESTDERMDFNLRYTLPSQELDPKDVNYDVKAFDKIGGLMLFGDQKVAYNLNDAGQFLWGQAMNRLGFSYSSAKIGSELFARGFEFSWDAEADQKAIREGFHYKTQVQTATSPGPFVGLPKEGFRRSAKRR
jgi:hypothetical protein